MASQRRKSFISYKPSRPRLGGVDRPEPIDRPGTTPLSRMGSFRPRKKNFVFAAQAAGGAAGRNGIFTKSICPRVQLTGFSVDSGSVECL